MLKKEFPISATLILLKIIGAVALLLWGARMIRHGLTRAYTNSLQKIIAKRTCNRIKAFFTGIGITAVLQSSTAAAILCASFASKRAISTAAGIAVVIGADVGTTLVAQVLTFDLSWLMPLLLLSGVIMHRQFEHKGKLKHIARSIIGLGLVLLALTLIKENALPLGKSELLPIILQTLQNEPILAIIIAALMTWIMHSSIAAVLIISSFVTSQVISLDLALILILGVNLGAAIAPFIMTYSMDARTRRITTANLIMRISMVIITLPLLLIILSKFEVTAMLTSISHERGVMHFHTLFNIALAIIFLPFVNVITSLSQKIIPDTKEEDNKIIKPLYLDESSLSSPILALACAAQETLRVAKIVEMMFSHCMHAIRTEDLTLLKSIKREDDKIDLLHTKTKFYLARITEEALDPVESKRFLQILEYSTNLEHMGDVIDNSLTGIIKEKIEDHHFFSDAGFKEICDFHNNVLVNMKIAQAVFMSEDQKLAKQLVKDKVQIRNAAKESQERHFQRLRKGVPESRMTSALHTDIIRDFKRVNSYLTTVAYAVLDQNDDEEKDDTEKKITA